MGFSFGGGGGGAAKVVLTLDDLIFINTQISKRVSPELGLFLLFLLLVDVGAPIASSLRLFVGQKLNDESILKSQLDMKTPHHSVSGRSYLASSPDSSNVAVFEVSLSSQVWLSSFAVLGLTTLFRPRRRVTGFG